jgi:hypothetical protein
VPVVTGVPFTIIHPSYRADEPRSSRFAIVKFNDCVLDALFFLQAAKRIERNAKKSKFFIVVNLMVKKINYLLSPLQKIFTNNY